MKKRFKTKKSVKNVIRTVILLVVLIILYIFMSSLSISINLGIGQESLMTLLLNDTNYYLYDKNRKTNLFLSTIYKIDIKKPVTLLQNTSYYIKNYEKTVLVYNEDYKGNIEPVIKEEKPLVYIYSTHPTETFKNELNVHNLEPNIKDVSFVLKDKLESIGVNTIVEEGDIPAFLKEHNYNYNYSYAASMHFLEQAYEKNPNIDLIIDLHRDGVAYEYSVTTIDDMKYAKIMFVVGLGHDNYKSSLNASNGINNYLKKYYPTISRGIYTRANQTYNQHFADNMILIELGGNNNELTEVLNSVDALALSIKEYLYENRG